MANEAVENEPIPDPELLEWGREYNRNLFFPLSIKKGVVFVSPHFYVARALDGRIGVADVRKVPVAQ